MSSAERWLGLAGQLLRQPTAPLFEDLPRAWVRNFAAARPGLDVDEDPAGNVVVRFRGDGAADAVPLVLVAHLDHPAFAVERVQDKVVELAFRGGVRAEHVAAGEGGGEPVRFYRAGGAEPVGSGRLLEVEEDKGRVVRARARVTRGQAVAGGFAGWSVGGVALRQGTIVAPACDDLLGAAAATCALDELSRQRPAGAAVWGLFTRAEEIGFLGTLEAVRHRVVPRQAAVVSLECSKALPEAPQGGGVIVRVGDARSTFDPVLTESLRQEAEAVRELDAGFCYQRKLMDGGTCEATAFVATGHRASGLALPLGGYHNMVTGDDGRPRIGPETVRIGDFVAEVRLLVALATRPAGWGPPSRRRPAWLADLARVARRELGSKPSGQRPGEEEFSRTGAGRAGGAGGLGLVARARLAGIAGLG